MRAAIYDHLQKLPVAFHDRWPAGQLMSRAVADLTTIRRFLAFGLVFLIVNLTTFVVGVVILLTLSWQLGLIIAALAIPLIALCALYETKYQVLARRSQDQVGDLATIVEESVLGIRILKAFGRSRYFGRRFLVEARDLRGTEIGKAKVISKLWAVIIALPEVAFGLTLFLGIIQVADGQMTAGALVAFFGVALGLRWPIDSIGWLLAMSNDAASATQRYFEVMDAPITVSSPARPRPAADTGGRVEFRGVRFRFADTPSTTDDLLRGVDLTLAPGETVALVGATGSGKTTLTSLVNRLYDVTAGSITLDGIDIRDLDLARPARPGCGRLRGADPVLRVDPGERAAGPARRLGRRGAAGALGGAGRLRARPAVGSGHPDRRTGPLVVRWPAPATRPGPGGGRSTRCSGARRPALRARHPHRGPGGAGAAVGAGADHGAGGGAPGVHGATRRPGRAPGRRPDHRGRHAFAADGRRARVSGPAGQPGRHDLRARGRSQRRRRCHRDRLRDEYPGDPGAGGGRRLARRRRRGLRRHLRPRRHQAAGQVAAAAPVADPTAPLVGPARLDGGGAQRVGLPGRAVGGGLRHRHRGARAGRR